MKKCYLMFSLLLCLFMTQQGYAQFNGGYDQDQSVNNGPAGYEEGGDYASASNNGEQCGDTPVSCVSICKYCRMKPCYYNTTRCDYVPKYTSKKCCRFVPEYYQKSCCRYVPQYYNKTCCRQVPQYYYTTQCSYCPKYTCERHCKYVPEYYYKRSCAPVNNCQPCQQPNNAYQSGEAYGCGAGNVDGGCGVNNRY